MLLERRDGGIRTRTSRVAASIDLRRSLEPAEDGNICGRPGAEEHDQATSKDDGRADRPHRANDGAGVGRQRTDLGGLGYPAAEDRLGHPGERLLRWVPELRRRCRGSVRLRAPRRGYGAVPRHGRQRQRRRARRLLRGSHGIGWVRDRAALRGWHVGLLRELGSAVRVHDVRRQLSRWGRRRQVQPW